MRYSIIVILAGLLFGVASAADDAPTAPAKQETEARPNIVLIFSDDMGYADLPRFGDSEIPTPAIDRLCDEGTLFTQAYVTAPVCVPSRMGLMSGRYQQRFGIYCNNYGPPSELDLWNREITVADVLQQGGYRTALVGKWHLGGNRWPLVGTPAQKRGFDEFVGLAGGMTNFVEGTTLYRDSKSFPAPEYLTDFFGTEACAFIDRNRARPFFLYLAFNAVHAPLEALASDEEALGKISSPDRRTYAAMLRSMDRSIGRVLDKLREHGLEEKTIVIFLNDNGGGGNHTPKHSRNTGRNAPLRGYKFDLYEGGVRVPMILRWPGRVAAGHVYRQVVSSLDIFPTLVGAARLDMPTGRAYDGVDLLPYLSGKKTGAPHEVLFWKNLVWRGPNGRQRRVHRVHNAALRSDRWKMVKLEESLDVDAPAPWALYDLERDVGEQHDLALEYPEVVARLERAYRQWLADMHPSVLTE